VLRHRSLHLPLLALLVLGPGACGSSDDPGGNTDSGLAPDLTADAPAALNVGFIGSPCEDESDCDFDYPRCLTDGLPRGMCSQGCVGGCPDREGTITTFCVTPSELRSTAAAGLCTMRCDYGASPTGCRAGYQCVPATRFGEEETVIYACVPGDDRPFALSACHRQLLAAGIAFNPSVDLGESPADHPELVCDPVDPIWLLDPVFHGVSLRLTTNEQVVPFLVSCPLALAIERTARILREERYAIDDLVHYGGYNCRVVAGSSTLSQHGLANALDVMALGRADGTRFTVLDHWERDQPAPVTAEGALLRDFVERLHQDRVFNVILTPDYDEYHTDHFHLDLTPGKHVLD
jgi:hypothetical protein